MILRRAVARLAAAIAILVCAPAARAQDEPAVPAYQGYVTDAAGVLSEGTRAKLEAFLDQVERKTGAQFAVLTVTSTAPLEPSDYKTRVFDQWKIGKKGKDNGLLLLVAMQERKIYFETGYGLEGALPDGLEARIVREQMVPAMRGGDVDGAVTAGVLAAATKIAQDQNVTLTWDGRELRYQRPSPIGAIPWWLPFFIVVLIAHVLRMLAFRGRTWLGPRGWGGGFGGFGGYGGFGGFGGGGGGSFGGFGGGSSGGGGGGGGW